MKNRKKIKDEMSRVEDNEEEEEEDEGEGGRRERRGSRANIRNN